VPLLSHQTSCTPTKSNLYLANSLAIVSDPTYTGQNSCPFPIASAVPEDQSKSKAIVNVL